MAGRKQKEANYKSLHCFPNVILNTGELQEASTVPAAGFLRSTHSVSQLSSHWDGFSFLYFIFGHVLIVDVFWFISLTNSYWITSSQRASSQQF